MSNGEAAVWCIGGTSPPEQVIPRCELVAGRSLKVFAEVRRLDGVVGARSGSLWLPFFSAVLSPATDPSAIATQPNDDFLGISRRSSGVPL
jgi:hypothetical protein